MRPIAACSYVARRVYVMSGCRSYIPHKYLSLQTRGLGIDVSLVEKTPRRHQNATFLWSIRHIEKPLLGAAGNFCAHWKQIKSNAILLFSQQREDGMAKRFVFNMVSCSFT